MHRNLIESIYGRASIEITHFVLIRIQIWPPSATLVSGWSIPKNLLLCNCLAKWTKTWWEAPMEGSVLSFLKAQWKVSYTGSVHWASSLFSFWFVIRVTRRVSTMDQVFSVVRVTRSWVLYVMCCWSFFLLSSFSVGHCVVCPYSIYRFWLPFWYIQTLIVVIWTPNFHSKR